MNYRKAFRCKNIYTAKTSDLIDGYLIIQNDKILTVGNLSETENFITAETEVFDFTDNFIMPGIHDYHIHLMSGAMMERDGDLRHADSEEEAAEIVWRNCRHGKRKWVLSNAWDHFRWPDQKLPNKRSLDKYFPDTPVFLLNKESHGAWVNSKLLEVFNITKDTPDPINGKYYREEDGSPSGYLHEAAMIPILEKIYSSISDEEIAESVKVFQKKANQYGITSVGDVSMFGISYERGYQKLEDERKLTIRIHFSKDIFDSLDVLKKAQKVFSGPMVHFNGVKAFIDGTPMGHTGYMLEPYSDKPGFKSEPLINPDRLYDLVTCLDREGIRIRMHACGDAGVRLCLDAFERAGRTNSTSNHRHCIEHIECTTPEDIKRFGELGVVPSIQPDHMPKYNFYGHPFHTMIGVNRMKYCYPFGSLLKSAKVLAYGTDFPVAPLIPTRGIWRAVHRLTDDGEPKGGWNPEERLTVDEILKSCTYGSAYAAGREHEIGTLAPGMLADFVVYPDNFFAIINDREKMFSQKSLLTVVGGRIVYQD